MLKKKFKCITHHQTPATTPRDIFKASQISYQNRKTCKYYLQHKIFDWSKEYNEIEDETIDIHLFFKINYFPLCLPLHINSFSLIIKIIRAFNLFKWSIKRNHPSEF